jgi:hypothetical protein
MEVRARSITLKQAFVKKQGEEEKARDLAESQVVKEFAKQLFQLVAKEPAEVRAAAGLQDYYDEWSFAFNDDGSEAPTIIVPTVAELQAAETAANVARADANKQRGNDRKRGR